MGKSLLVAGGRIIGVNDAMLPVVIQETSDGGQDSLAQPIRTLPLRRVPIPVAGRHRHDVNALIASYYARVFQMPVSPSVARFDVEPAGRARELVLDLC